MAARVGAARAPAPDLGQGEHLRQYPECAVGLIGPVAHTVMQRGDVLALHLRNPKPSHRGTNEQPHQATVLMLRARLAVGRDVLLQEPVAWIGHVGLGFAPSFGATGVDTLPRASEDIQCLPTRLTRGQGAVGAEPSQPVGDAGLDDIVLAPRASHAHAEAGQLAVPMDGIGAVGLEGVNGALGEACRPVCYV